MVSLYVNGLLVNGSCRMLPIEFKKQMQAKLECLILETRPIFLSKQEVFISQKILNRFCMENYKPIDTPIAQGNYRSLIGCLLYLTTLKLDIMFFVSLLLRYMHCYNVVHFKIEKRALKYVKVTLSYGIKYVKENELKLTGLTYNDWVGSVKDMKSTSGYFFTLGSKIVAQSTTEAEYIATATAISQTLWLRKLMFDLNLIQWEITKIYYDNQSVVSIAKNSVFHGKTKHLKIKHHFVREVEQSNEVNLVHCRLDDKLVDILTNPIGKIRFERLRHDIGVRNIMTKEECCEVVTKLQAHPNLRVHPELQDQTQLRAHESCEHNQSCKLIKHASSTNM
ncbi:laccase-2-like [Gossypium australe]|uniref:Laccase-2-like n=1 Tax=Gossypium australe TaxID=47621 RepID=A0A5B6W9T6_9ROSI|nr:laccase-2-like [Gossypium australe]